VNAPPRWHPFDGQHQTTVVLFAIAAIANIAPVLAAMQVDSMRSLRFG
jgi:hypothetical protein